MVESKASEEEKIIEDVEAELMMSESESEADNIEQSKRRQRREQEPGCVVEIPEGTLGKLCNKARLENVLSAGTPERNTRNKTKSRIQKPILFKLDIRKRKKSKKLEKYEKLQKTMKLWERRLKQFEVKAELLGCEYAVKRLELYEDETKAIEKYISDDFGASARASKPISEETPEKVEDLPAHRLFRIPLKDLYMLWNTILEKRLEVAQLRKDR